MTVPSRRLAKQMNQRTFTALSCSIIQSSSLFLDKRGRACVLKRASSFSSKTSDDSVKIASKINNIRGGNSNHVVNNIRRRRYYTKDPLSGLGFEKRYRIRSQIELLIGDYTNKPIPSLSFNYLTNYKPPLTENDIYTLSVQTINLLLSYTCRRLDAIQKLPYIAVLNPNIEVSNSLYLRTLESLLSIEYPYGLHNKRNMITLLSGFLDDHQDTLETLSRGLQEISEFYPKEKIFDFLDHHLRDRISMKLLVTHYLSLIDQTKKLNNEKSTEYKMIGILHKELNVGELVKQVAEFVGDLTYIKYDRIVPVKIVEGEGINFPCIPTILEYTLTEVFKNSSRAHIETSTLDNDLTEKPIEVTIIQSDEEKLEIRIRDFGGGIAPDVEAKMFEYSYSTAEEIKHDNGSEAYMLPGEDTNNVCGMGFGLPLCRAYMEMLDGRLDIQSLWGWGTDVYIKLKGPGKKLLN